MKLFYNETVTLVKVITSNYGNSKIMSEQIGVPAIFLQGTSFSRSSSAENTTADAVCYVDPLSTFVSDNNYRLEGFYVLAPLFDVADSEGWYKVVSVIINRDHLLSNSIDNVQLVLKKSRAPYGVS